MARRIVQVQSGSADALRRVGAIRDSGDIPLVIDDRIPRAHLRDIDALLRSAAIPECAGWATMTSGTTGMPRVVVRTHESWRSSFAHVSAMLEPDERGGIHLPSPLSSSMTLFSVAHALEGGPRPHLAGEPRRVSAFHGTPETLRTWLGQEDAHPRVALVGGSRLDDRTREEAHRQGVRVIGYYGAAELSFVAVDDGDGLRPFPGVEVDIRHGELWVRSPYVALGYLGGSGPLRADGPWATVGDRAAWDDGRIVLRGRSDEAILTASATVIPEEVEQALRQVSGIEDAVVFGVARAGIGDLVAVLVEMAPGTSVKTVRESVRVLFAPAQRPRLWFTGSIPRTLSGKPARAEVRRLARAGRIRRIA